MKKITTENAVRSVDEYLLPLPEDVRTMLENVRQAIWAAAPKAEEVISYQIPTYKFHGPLVHFAAFKDHCSFVAVSKTVIPKFKKELAGYKTSGRTIHFSIDNPLSPALIKKIVKLRVAENKEMDVLKKKKEKL
jgi:uncharacterized protein YdhG (YjbR/CyaY superfamily)